MNHYSERRQIDKIHQAKVVVKNRSLSKDRNTEGLLGFNNDTNRAKDSQAEFLKIIMINNN
jgi:hypothetical protein